MCVLIAHLISISVEPAYRVVVYCREIVLSILVRHAIALGVVVGLYATHLIAALVVCALIPAVIVRIGLYLFIAAIIRLFSLLLRE